MLNHQDEAMATSAKQVNDEMLRLLSVSRPSTMERMRHVFRGSVSKEFVEGMLKFVTHWSLQYNLELDAVPRNSSVISARTITSNAMTGDAVADHYRDKTLTSLNASVEETYSLFKSGESLDSIAKTKNLTCVTIKRHLVRIHISQARFLLCSYMERCMHVSRLIRNLFVGDNTEHW